MTQILISDRDYNKKNLLYIQSSLTELFEQAGCKLEIQTVGSRVQLCIECPQYFQDIVLTEVADKIAEIVAIGYKYEFFKGEIKLSGLSETEMEILLASLIAADLDNDKKYAFERYKGLYDIAIDGIYHFRLQPLKKKWADIVSYMPSVFMESQLKEFITYLLENKKKRVYVDSGLVFDSHYRKLNRTELLGGENVKIIREILLSNCGEVELNCDIPKDDEKYLKDFYSDKIYFQNRYFNQNS